MVVGDSGVKHWDDVYSRKGADAVSWFKPRLEVSLRLIEEIGLPKTAKIIDVGGGASTLADDLLARGYEDVTVLDLSAEALEIARARLGPRGDKVRWIVGDITNIELDPQAFDFWHDRAVFHFLTDAEDRARYVALARRALKPDAHIVVATFGLEGPEKCSGLEIVRYDPDGLHATFGTPFEKIGHEAEVHETPWGTEQEFVYCYCRRRA